MGNSCTGNTKNYNNPNNTNKLNRNRLKLGNLYVESKSKKIAYQGDQNGISPVTMDTLQMSTQTQSIHSNNTENKNNNNNLNNLNNINVKSNNIRNSIDQCYIPNSTPISGQAYKNYIKIQINSLPTYSSINNNNNINLSKFSNIQSEQNQQQQQPQSINFTNNNTKTKQSSKNKSEQNQNQQQQNANNTNNIQLTIQEIREQLINEYQIDQDTINSNDINDIKQQKLQKNNTNKQQQKNENILKDFTKKENRGCMWRGPTMNSLFDAFYLAFTMNEDLVLNPHDIWDQIVYTLKSFYLKNHIPIIDVFPNPKVMSKQSKVIHYKEISQGNKNKRELISWDQILKQIQEHNQELIQKQKKVSPNNSNDLNTDIKNSNNNNNSDDDEQNVLSNNFQIKRISQFVYNQLIFLDQSSQNNNNNSESSNQQFLPYKIYPGHNYQIRNIVFRSSLSDWLLLREKILNLIEIAPEFWIERLYFIVDNFVDTLQGKLNHSFWNQGFLMESQEYLGYCKFGWMMELFNIEFDNPNIFQKGRICTCQNIQNYQLSKPFIFRIEEHKIDINMKIKTNKSCLISHKNLPNSFEPLLTMYLVSTNSSGGQN